MGTEERTHLGHLLGPHGVQGAVKVYVLGDPGQFRRLPRVFVEGRGWLRVVKADPLAPGVALSLAGIGTREAAEELRGLPIYAADDELPPPEDGVYYYHELRGLQVLDAAGTVLGEVVDVQEAGRQDLLVVRHAAGESLVPLQAPYVVVELGSKRRPASLTLRADAPEGLLGDAAEDGADEA